MTGFSRWMRIILGVFSWIVIMVIGSCLDSIPLTDLRVWAVLLISIAVMGVCAHDMS